MVPRSRPAWVDELDGWHVLTASKVLLIVVLAFLANWVARRSIRRAVSGMHTLRSSMGGYKGKRVEQRSKTITAVLRSAASAVIWGLAVIAILGQLGVNVAAFVAGASIIGGVLAFGAQQIVRDLLAGFFMFTEDQYGVGDSVDLGLAEGTVEEVSLRVTRLQGIDGKIWYVPHGQIARVANLSQEWSQAIIDVPVDRNADLDAAAETIQAVASTLADDPSLGPVLLGPPRVLGVQDVLDDRAILRLAIRIKPGARLEVQRAVRARLLEAVREGRLHAPPGPPVTPDSAPATPAAPTTGATE